MEIDKPVAEEEILSANFPRFKKLSRVEYVNNLFNKRFSMDCNDCYSLPDPQTMFTCPVWHIEELQVLKRELNGIKNLLNDYNSNEWHMHTSNRNSAKKVRLYLKSQVEPEFLTQAWCKFYEILSSFPVIPVIHINNNNGHFKSVHLCEAPGAFVTSLNHWLQTNVPGVQWDWTATTLNPYYEGHSSDKMITDDRFIRHTLDHWCFGKNNTGDLMNLDNFNDLMKASAPHNNTFLVTADGSIDCTYDPGEQENIVSHLHFCETTAALHFLQTGGSFVIKIFTTFECHTICLMYLLCCCFNEVHVVKPSTSKEGNSESYVVCINFKGRSMVLPYLQELIKYYEHSSDKAMFNKDSIPCTFISKIVKCSKLFKYHQSLVIMDNVMTFKSDSTKTFSDMKRIQHIVAQKYIADYNIRKIMSGDIVGNTTLAQSIKTTSRTRVHESYNECCERRQLAPLKQLKAIYDDSSKLVIMDIKLHETLKITINDYQIPGCLHISVAKIFREVLSSRFCIDHIFRTRRKIDDILVNMGCTVNYPPLIKTNKLKNKILCRSGHKILTFQFTDVYDTHNIITSIYDTIQSLDTGDTLVLICYPLLTSFTFGLLYLISRTFDSIEMEYHSDVGSLITLENYKNSKEVLKHLNDVEAKSSDIQGTDYAIFQIFPAMFLYECDLFFLAISSNYWIIKSYSQYVFSAFQKALMNEKT